MKMTLENIKSEWKAKIHIFVCSSMTLCILVFWFLKARPQIFACCMLALCFFLLVFVGSASAETSTLDAQGWVYSPNIPTAVYLAEDGDMVLVYTREYNENAVVNKCLTPIAKIGMLQQPATVLHAHVCLKRTKMTYQ